jgi:hypothetical protein
MSRQEATMSTDDPTPLCIEALPRVPLIPERRSPRSAWQEFASWPGATSLITLLSAALLLIGLYGVIEPAIGEPGRLAPRWQVLGVLAAYLGALLAGIWAMCRVRAGNPDAVASVMVGAVLAVGYGVVIHLLAVDQLRLAAGAAVAGWLGMLGLGAAFSRVTANSPWAALGWVLAALYAWTSLWPVVLASVVADQARRMPNAGAGAPGTDVAAMVCWSIGWMMLLAVLLALLWLVGRAPIRRQAGVAFLARPVMRWVLALVASGTAVVALAVQAHVAGLDLAWTDCLPHVALLILVGNELAVRAYGRRMVRDACAVAAPAALAAWITLAGCGPSGEAFRGAGWAPQLVGMAGTAPGLPVLLAGLAVLLGMRRRSSGLQWGMGLSLIIALLSWDAQRPLLAEAGVLAACTAAVAGWRAARPELGVTAAATTAGLLPATRPVELLLGAHQPTTLLAIIAAASVILLLATWRPAWVQRGWARFAAWLLGVVMAGDVLLLLAGRRSAATPLSLGIEIGVVAAVLLLIGVCAWRRRDAGVGLAVGPAGLVLLWPLRVLLGWAWLAVWAAFILLGTGVLLAVRRVRLGRS